MDDISRRRRLGDLDAADGDPDRVDRHRLGGRGAGPGVGAPAGIPRAVLAGFGRPPRSRGGRLMVCRACAGPGRR